MPYYNIYLNSPQLAYNANTKKYYKNVINNNKLLYNRKFKKYTPLYFTTSYNRIFTPNYIIYPF